MSSAIDYYVIFGSMQIIVQLYRSWTTWANFSELQNETNAGLYDLENKTMGLHISRTVLPH